MEILDALNVSVTEILNQTMTNVKTLAIVLLVLWVVFFISYLTNKRLLLWGIFPRQRRGLPGILLAPLLHTNFNHIFFNSIPLLVLSDFLLINGLTYFLEVTLLITLISGTLIWCFAKSGLHVGASAVITGYWSLLVCDIYHQGSVTAILLGLLSLYYFAGIFFGILPGKRGVSWEGHLFGLLAGIATSFILPYLQKII